MRKYKSEWTNFKEVPNRIGLGLWCYVFFKMLLSISISLKSILLMLILVSIFFRKFLFDINILGTPGSDKNQGKITKICWQYVVIIFVISLSQIDFYMFFEFARSPTNIDRTTETLSSVMNHFRQDGLTLIGLQKGKVNTNEKKLPSWLNVVSLSKEQSYQIKVVQIYNCSRQLAWTGKNAATCPLVWN